MSQYLIVSDIARLKQEISVNEANIKNETRKIQRKLRKNVAECEIKKPKYIYIEGKNQRHRIVDITGKKYGLLTAVQPTDKRSGSAVIWECRCDCGGVTYRPHTRLNDWRKYQSCGCLKPGNLNMKEWMEANFIDGTCITKIRDLKAYATNTSGTRGVYYRPRSDRWSATIGFKGKKYYLGTYETIEEAILARKKAEDELYKPFIEELELGNKNQKYSIKLPTSSPHL